MKKIVVALCILSVALFVSGCGISADVSEKMSSLKEDDIKFTFSTLIGTGDNACEVTKALNEAANREIKADDSIRLHYELEVYLSGKPDAYSSDDERFRIFAGLAKNIVKVCYDSENGKTKSAFFEDEKLYNLVRGCYKTEISIDETEYEKYRTIIENRAERLREEAGFTGYKITHFNKKDTFTDGDATYDIYSCDSVFECQNPDDPEQVTLAGGMYLDADARICGYDEFTYFVVKNPDAKSFPLYRFLFWDLYSGSEENDTEKAILDKISDAFKPEVSAEWASDDAAYYDEAVFENPGTFAVKIVFSARKRVSNFKILDLSPSILSSTKYNIKEKYSKEEFLPEKPLIAQVSFYGLFPNNGISFVDDSGETRRYALVVSGDDGTIILYEI